MKCGYFQFEEYYDPYRVVYTCNKYHLIAGTEKNLCKGCKIKNGEPFIDELFNGDDNG